ncbi:MAG: hypothetical protein AB7F59_10420 [Bdellovibrionales bacterium]
MLSSFLVSLALVSFAQAQTVDVRDVKPDGSQTTTIEITKGEKSKKSAESQWEVEKGEDTIDGEHMPLKKEAREEWKKACATWKKEFRDENKDNKIIHVSCGQPTCISETEGSICRSKATYKIKTRLD